MPRGDGAPRASLLLSPWGLGSQQPHCAYQHLVRLFPLSCREWGVGGEENRFQVATPHLEVPPAPLGFRGLSWGVSPT